MNIITDRISFKKIKKVDKRDRLIGSRIDRSKGEYDRILLKLINVKQRENGKDM